MQGISAAAIAHLHHRLAQIDRQVTEHRRRAAPTAPFGTVVDVFGKGRHEVAEDLVELQELLEIRASFGNGKEHVEDQEACREHVTLADLSPAPGLSDGPLEKQQAGPCDLRDIASGPMPARHLEAPRLLLEILQHEPASAAKEHA